jgi:hypothetical protein
VVVAEPVAAEWMAEHQVMADQVMLVVLAVSQDQTTRPVEQKIMVQESLQAAQAHSITLQV